MSINARGGKNVQKLVGIGKSLHLLVFSKQVALDRFAIILVVVYVLFARERRHL